MRKIIRSLARRWNQLWKQFVARMQRKAMLLDLRQSFMALETRQVLAGASFNPGLGVLSMQLQNGETATLSQNLDQFVLDLPDAEPDVVGNIADLVRIEAKGIGPGNNGTFLWGGVTNNDFTAANVITLSVQDILSTDVNVQSQGIIIQGDSSASNFSMVNSGSIQLTNEATSPFTFGESLTLITTNDASGIRIDGNLQAANNTLNPDVIIRTEGIDAAIFIDGNISLAGDPGAGPNSTLTIETFGTGGSSDVGISFVSSQITTTDDATDISLRSLGGNIDMDNASRIDAMAGSIELTANSSVKFTGLNSSNTDPNAIQVTSQTSELIDANALSTDANASLGGIFLRAANGIGNTDTLEVRVGTLSAINSTSGKISIFNQSVSTDNDLILDLVENANRDIEIFNESAGIQQTSSGHIIGNQVTLIADAGVFDLVNLDTPLRSSFNRSISLANSTNAVSSLIGLATGEILLTTQNDLNVIALRAQESIASPGGFEFQSTAGINQIIIQSLSANITQGNLPSNQIATHRFSATANNGSVTLDNTNNNALNVSGSAQNNFLYTDANSFEVQGITAGNDVTISAETGSITQATGAANAIRSSRTNATANNGSVTLDNTNNNALNVSGSAQNNFLYTDSNSFEVQGITAGNDVTISAQDGSITQAAGGSNAIRSSRTNATANNGSVTLDNTNNNALSVSGSAQNNFLYTDANSFEVQGITAGNDVTISALNASITQAAGAANAIRSSRTNAIANNGSVTLDNTNNNALNVSGSAQNNFLYTDANSFEVQGITAGNDVTISALNGSITQATGAANAIRSSRTNATANNGSVTLDNTNNNALSVSGSAQNNFLYTDANSFEVQGITAGNDVTISALNGSITQATGAANAIRSSRTNATANNGSVTLDNTNNNALSVSGSAQNNFLYTDANSFEVQGITAGNDVTISAQDGSITQAAGASNAIRSSRTNATANNGSVTLDNTNNNALNVSGSAQNNFIYTDANSFEVQGITAGNDVTISALNGSITQATGAANAIRSSRTNATANNGSVTLDNTNNNALNVSGSAQNNFLYTDANSFEVQGITSGGDVVLTTVAGGITQASSSTAGIKADKLTLRIDATTTPDANQITVDGWGRNNATLNSVVNDVNKLDAISSGSIRFVNNGSLQVGTIVALSKDFVTGSTNTVATIANEVSLDSRQGGISQIYSPVTPQYNPFQAHSLRAVVATHAFFPDIDVVRLKISPLKDNVLKNSNLPSVLGDVFNDGSTLSQVYNAANASASKFLDTLATNNPRFVVTQELRDIYSLTKYNNNFAVLVLNRGDLIVDGIHAFEGKVSSAQGDSITAPNFLVATVESTASAVKGASAGDLIIPADSKIEGLSLGKEPPVVVGQDSGLVILAGRDLIFGTAPSLTSGQIGTTPLTDNPQYRQIVLSKSLAEKFYNGGEGVGNILSTEYVVGAETSWKDSKNPTHQQQRVALDFGTQLAGGPERGFDVIISYFDGRTQRFANATKQGTTYPLPQSDPSIPPGPTNPLLLPTDERISIPSTKIASGIEDSQFRNNVVFQRTEPLAVRSIDMLRMLTPTNTLATNAVVRRSADFFMFENVNSAFTDPSGLQDITFASSYIDDVKPLVLAWSMMDENPPMQMPQILPSEMMELEDRLPLIRQDKSDIEIKAAQRTVEVAVYDIGYVDVDTSTNASNNDSLMNHRSIMLSMSNNRC